MLMQLELSVFTVVIQKMKSYSECIQYPTYEERLEYLKIFGSVGFDTFGYDRYLNQALYRCSEWKRTRNNIIIRDKSCDLAVDGYEIIVKGIVHHINPITIEDILERRPIVFDPDNLIFCSLATHNAIHYGGEGSNPNLVVERRMNDTIPWR